jgi:hypothetical protein
MNVFSFVFVRVHSWFKNTAFMRPRADTRWFAWVVSAFLVAVATVALVVLAVNPYQLYGVSLLKPAYINAHAYQMLPGLLRREQYETVAVGSCMAQNFRVSDMEAVPGWGRVVKASGGGASTRTLERFITAALDAGRARHIFLLLDTPLTVGGGGGIFNLEDQILEYLYDDTVWNDYQYFLNWDVLTGAVPRTLKANLGSRRFKPSLERDMMFAWDFGNRPHRFNEDEVREGFVRWGDALADVREHAAEQAAFYQKNVEERLFTNIRENPGIRFTVCLAPYSSAFWHALHAYGGLEPFLGARANLMRQMLAFGNTAVYDFQGDPVTENYAHYSDPWHYDANINAWIIRSIAEGRGRIENEEDIESANRAVRERCHPERRPAWIAELIDKPKAP